ncbi:hypothetical protein [Burkholderia sp. Ax-1719]|uniref:hypothetical protein n=1 Tax=Burkholderia sp. Ax-1719 TaxID=2608334 RepID=UPI00141D98D5|nr:hypothetical protein [Burkholderia sp. Ax-1719]NIE63173.1 hypothetical protein [Burkholderia sp. Ax-1719]
MDAALQTGERYLYHGTSSTAWAAIMHAGKLQARGALPGNWTHTAESHAGVVYLTTAYAAYFAACATRQGDCGVVLEIDVEALHADILCCDEDAYALLDLKNLYPEKSVYELAAMAKEALPTGPEVAAASLQLMGNCGYLADIPLSAVTRVVQIEWQANPELAHAALEPVISPQNYRLFGPAYRKLTRWLFEEVIEGLTETELWSQMQPLPSRRDGLTLLPTKVWQELG